MVDFNAADYFLKYLTELFSGIDAQFHRFAIF